MIDGVELEGLEWQPHDADGNAVAPDADNIDGYEWVGYSYEYNGSTYKNREDISYEGPYEINRVQPQGTVSRAQVNYFQNGVEFADYFGVDGSFNPIAETYIRAPWLTEARRHIGLDEVESNDQIYNWAWNMNQAFGRTDYNFETPTQDDDPTVTDGTGEWCGVFVYRCLTEAGVPVTGNSWHNPGYSQFYPSSWVEGTVIQQPFYGAIVRMTYSHIAFVVNYDDNYVWILGGNQPADNTATRSGSTVNIRRYRRTLVDRFIKPNDYEIPPLD